MASRQTTGREHRPTHQQQIGLKIYCVWSHPLEQDPVYPTANRPSHQEPSAAAAAAAAAKSLQSSDSVRPHRRQPTRLPRPWDSPGKNTGVGCHFLLQCMKVKSESEVTQLCPTLHDPMDCSPPGSSVHGIFQARVLEWGAIAFHPSHQEPSTSLLSSSIRGQIE